MEIDGGCHCGAIAYTAEIEPADVWLCHCTDCQTLSGSPFRAVVAASAASFVLKSGTLKRYAKTAENGARRIQTFCPDCGTPICGSADTPEPETLGLRWGSIHQRTALAPARQFWCRSAEAWTQDIRTTPAVDAE